MMQKSEFFDALSSMYEAEMDDLLSDSDGKNVLARRLQTKRDQLADLLPMMDFAPNLAATPSSLWLQRWSFCACMKPAAVARPRRLRPMLHPARVAATMTATMTVTIKILQNPATTG